MILEFGGKISNLSAKIMQGVGHLWTRILLVQKFRTKKTPLDSTPVGENIPDPKTLTNNRLFKTQRKIAKRVCTRV